MRRQPLLTVIALLALAGCKDVSAPTVTLAPPPHARYQLTAAGTLDAEISALITALYPPRPRLVITAGWLAIKHELAEGDPKDARRLLTALSQVIVKSEPLMNPPPANESKTGAAARLVLYMSLYVYSGSDTPPPPQFGAGADATAAIVTPTAPALVQTPTKHASSRFDDGSVSENTVIVITQNTTPYLEKCSGPQASKYCSYPLYYHYYAFPHVKFNKPVHVAICHVHPGDAYGPLPGVDHDQLVLAHDKPAIASDATPGGYMVPGENIEILPRNTGLPPTPPVACTGTKYPQVALFKVPRLPSGALEQAYALAARAVNGAASAVGRALTPRDAYAIDNGVEHNTLLYSNAWLIDTNGHPDLGVTGSAVSQTTVAP
jgi:hypothetical protein